MSDRITVMCVDDHSVVLDGIALVLNLQTDITVVATTTRGEDALELYRKHRPDVTLMDLRLRGMDGVDTIKAIRGEFPEARVVVLTMYEGDQDVYRALAAGADAYVLKDSHSDELIRVVRDVHEGRTVDPGAPNSVAHAALSRREQQVLQLIAAGMRNREMAARMGISEETVHTHLRNIFQKLSVSDRAHALAVAVRRGIVHLR
ncbi:MAG: response regulator transcription factor [Acidobacteria bacterium]|nr:response regulator transcription factor [Acidobacteriota bacterium]